MAKTCYKTSRRYLNDLFVVKHLRSRLASAERSSGTLYFQTEGVFGGINWNTKLVSLLHTLVIKALLAFPHIYHWFQTSMQEKIRNMKCPWELYSPRKAKGGTGRGRGWQQIMLNQFQSSMQTQQSTWARSRGILPGVWIAGNTNLSQWTPKKQFTYLGKH